MGESRIQPRHDEGYGLPYVGLYIASFMTYVQLVVHYISNFVGDYVLVQSNVPS